MSTDATSDPTQLDSVIETESSDGSSAQTQNSEEVLKHENRNLIVLGMHYTLLRVAWVFKTETVIMPVFLDTIAGAGWLRGCLPVLNRIGQSIPPLFLANRLRNAPLKKLALRYMTIAMAIPFMLLSAICFQLDDLRTAWMPAVFLTCYTVFFAATGLNNLSMGTVQGKLIRANRRGRLMGIAGIVGSIVSITAAWFLLQRWLELENGFRYIFAFTGCGFVVASLSTWFIKEPRDDVEPLYQPAMHHLRNAWQVIRSDASFRATAAFGMCFSTIILLFPHFQALGRERLQLQSDGFQLMLWVITQNVTVGLASFLLGMLADRKGNRLVLRVEGFITALTPVFALVLSSSFVDDGRRWYWLTFCLLGLTPVTIKTITNYTLELTEPINHPRYVSTMSLCLAVPFLLSPLVGLLVDKLGFDIVFISGAIVVAISGFLTFRMREPRHNA
ncbi:MAG: hypothetical protein CMJ78_03145 [Planctomycetaceae bacterium]|nr:hypothetical protein [Planctomycetaceae bacterium]